MVTKASYTWKGGGAGNSHPAFQVVFIFVLIAAWVEGSCPPLVCRCPSPDTVDCSGSGLTVLPAGLSPVVRKLDLSANRLENVNVTELFSGLPALETLDLSRNGIKSFGSSSSTGGGILSHGLRHLNLAGNNITSVRRGLRLRGLVTLESLDLSGNRIMSLPANGFRSVGKSLIRLSLKNNKMTNVVDPDAFGNLKVLEELNLSKNKMSSFPKQLFLNLKKLQVLEMNKNKFEQITSLSFQGLTSLKILKFKRNQIKYLMDGAFFGLESIEELHLDRNRVETVGKGWLYGLTTLRYLSLSRNEVNYIADDGWEFCRALETLDLSHNSLLILERESLLNLPRLKRLYLQHNSISHVATESTQKDKPLFSDVPLLEEIWLDGNQISHTIEDTSAPFRSLRHLRLISLSQNQIQSVGKNAFGGGLDNLETIDLRGNVISTMQENAFEFLPNIREISLDSSSVLCDCYFKWFPKWLNTTGVVGGEKATCAHPETLKGQVVQRVAYEDYTCDDFPKPYIIQQPETQITLKGSNMTLYCRAASTSPEEMTFGWKMDSSVSLDFGSCSARTDKTKGCVSNRAHSFDGKGREVTSELHLHNMTYEDAGKYQCVVKNKFGTTYSERANITVYVYPTFVVTPEDVIVKAGNTASMKCGAQGVPAPEVKWSKDSGADFPAARERRITQNNSPQQTFLNNPGDGEDQMMSFNSFEIWSINSRDAGVYSCVASNPAGSISWNITLSVQEMPKFTTVMNDKKVAKGESAVIECKGEASPSPNVTWFKDGSELTATERHFFAVNDQVLVVVKANEQDAGRYECRMENLMGSVSQSGLLTVVDCLSESASGDAQCPGGGGPAGGLFGNPTVVVVVAAVIGLIAVLVIFLGVILWCRIYRKRQSSRHRTPPQARRSEPSREGVPERLSRASSSAAVTTVDRAVRPGPPSPIHHQQHNSTATTSPDFSDFNIEQHVRDQLEHAKTKNLHQQSHQTERLGSGGAVAAETTESELEMTRLLEKTERAMRLATETSGVLSNPPPNSNLTVPPLHCESDLYYSERDSGTGDSKKSDSNEDDELNMQVVEPEEEEEPLYENYTPGPKIQIRSGSRTLGHSPRQQRHRHRPHPQRPFLNLSASGAELNGAGESLAAMDLEEFEATKTTVITDDEDEVDSALGGGTGGHHHGVAGSRDVLGSPAPEKSPENEFRTFYPRGVSTATSNLDLSHPFSGGRAGPDFLTITVTPSHVTSPSTTGPLEAQVRRGGIGSCSSSNRTASMMELHQRLLEESLNCSDHVLDRRKAAAAEAATAVVSRADSGMGVMSRNSASRTSLVFSRNQHNNHFPDQSSYSKGGLASTVSGIQSATHLSLPRRHRNKSGGRTGSYYGKYKKSKGGGGGDQPPMANGEGGGLQPPNIHHSQVVNKGTDQFFA